MSNKWHKPSLVEGSNQVRLHSIYEQTSVNFRKSDSILLLRTFFPLSLYITLEGEKRASVKKKVEKSYITKSVICKSKTLRL